MMMMILQAGRDISHYHSAYCGIRVKKGGGAAWVFGR